MTGGLETGCGKAERGDDAARNHDDEEDDSGTKFTRRNMEDHDDERCHNKDRNTIDEYRSWEQTKVRDEERLPPWREPM